VISIGHGSRSTPVDGAGQHDLPLAHRFMIEPDATPLAALQNRLAQLQW
jgi:hypothetical protein